MSKVKPDLGVSKCKLRRSLRRYETRKKNATGLLMQSRAPIRSWWDTMYGIRRWSERMKR